MEKLSGGGSYDLKQVLGNGPDSWGACEWTYGHWVSI